MAQVNVHFGACCCILKPVQHHTKIVASFVIRQTRIGSAFASILPRISELPSFTERGLLILAGYMSAETSVPREKHGECGAG